MMNAGLAMIAAPRAVAGVGGRAIVASNNTGRGFKDFEVSFGEVRGLRVAIACATGCHAVRNMMRDGKRYLEGARPLPPVECDDRRGYVFREGARRWFVWKGGVGPHLVAHPESRLCRVNPAAMNSERIMPVPPEEHLRFIRLAAPETTVDDARSAGIVTGCPACGGTHSTMRMSGIVGYLFDNAFVDAGCVVAHASARRGSLQFLAWEVHGRNLVPRVHPAERKVVTDFWAAQAVRYRAA